MLEIFIVYRLAKSIGDKVAAKGHKRFGYQLMLVALWIGGEIAGMVVGIVLQLAMAGGVAEESETGFPWMAYLCALAGAALGAFIAFAIANSVAPVQNDDDFYQIDERRRDDEVRRAWRTAEDKPLPDGDQIQQRPALRSEEDRIQE
jgi:membrane protein DedA with SNARE-associated domain